MFGSWVEANNLTLRADFDELLTWLKPLIEAEEKLGINDIFTSEKKTQ